MSQAADDQPDQPAYCQYRTTRNETVYWCVKEVHKGGGHDLKKLDDIGDPLRAYFAATAVADLEDRDTAELEKQMAERRVGAMKADLDDTAELVPADPPSADEATLAKRFQRDVQFLERKQFADRYAYEVGEGHALMEDLYALDESRWAENLTADEASLRRIKARVDAWLLQVGIREDGGA